MDQASLSIGRDASNSIQLHDTEISRRHVQLRRRGTYFTLADQKSSNGTFVNGEPITKHKLATGDQVQLGRTLLLYTGFSGPAPEDLSDKVDIVSRQNSSNSSHIVRAMSQKEGSVLLGDPVGDSKSPWLARAHSNLQIMYHTALAVSHTLDIDRLLSRIMDMIFEWVDADRGCIMLKDPETMVLEPKVRRHRRGVRADEKITISKTILDYVVERNEGVLTSNAREDERWNTAQSILQMGVREAICVPMQGRYDVVGVVYIDTSIAPQKMIAQQGHANKFTEEHLKLMIAIAHQAALAVEDTSYYKAMVQAERLAAVGQTIATLSHHIKNILQGVRGGSYLIELGLKDHRQNAGEQGLDSSQLVQAVETISKGWKIVEKNQEKISALVMDMLTFSKEREPEPVPANLNGVTGDVVQMMRVRAEELDVVLHWKAAKKMPLLMFDAEAMHRAVLNVVTNAIDACDSEPQGRVEISTEYVPDKKLARIVVADNGSGIAPEDLEKIFVLFISRKGGRGTGLGLPVSQKILKEHGGSVSVESELGVGSRFILELPIVLVNAVRETASTQVAEEQEAR